MILSELCMELKANLHAQLHHMPVRHAMAQENGYDSSTILMDSAMNSMLDLADDGNGDIDNYAILDSISEEDRASLLPIIRVAFPKTLHFRHHSSQNSSANTFTGPAIVSVTDLMANKKLLQKDHEDFDRSSSVLSLEEGKSSERYIASVMDGYDGRETIYYNAVSVQDMAEATRMYGNGSPCLLVSSPVHHLFGRRAMENATSSAASALSYNADTAADTNSTNDLPWVLKMNQCELGMQSSACNYVSLQNPSEVLQRKSHPKMQGEVLSLVQSNVPSGYVYSSAPSAQIKRNGSLVGSPWNHMPHRVDDEQNFSESLQASLKSYEVQKDEALKICNPHVKINDSSLQFHKPIIQQKAEALQTFNKPQKKVRRLEGCYNKYPEKVSVGSLQVSKTDQGKAESCLKADSAQEHKASSSSLHVSKLQLKAQQKAESLKSFNAREQINAESSEVSNAHEHKFSNVSLQQKTNFWKVHTAQQKTVQFGSHPFMVNSIVGSPNTSSKHVYNNASDQFAYGTNLLVDPLLDQFANGSSSADNSQFQHIHSPSVAALELKSSKSLVVQQEKNLTNYFAGHGNEFGNSMTIAEDNPPNKIPKEGLIHSVLNSQHLENLPLPEMQQINSSKIKTKNESLIPSPSWLDGDISKASGMNQNIVLACENHEKPKEVVSTITMASTPLDHHIFNTVDKAKDENTDQAFLSSHMSRYSNIEKENAKSGNSYPSSREELGINWNGIDLWSGIQSSFPKEGNRVALLSESIVPILLADDNLILSSIEYMGPSHSLNCSLPSLKCITSESSTTTGCQANECNLLDHEVCFDGHASDINGDKQVVSCDIKGSGSSGREDCPSNGLIHKHYTDEHTFHSNASASNLSDIGISKLNQSEHLHIDAAAKCKKDVHGEQVSDTFCTETMCKQRQPLGKDIGCLSKYKGSKGRGNKFAVVDIQTDTGRKRQRISVKSMNDPTKSGDEKQANSLSEVLLSMLVESGNHGLTVYEVLKKLLEEGKTELLGSHKPQALQVKVTLRTLPNVKELPGCRFALIESCVEATNFGKEGYGVLKNGEESSPLQPSRGKKPKNHQVKGKFHSLAHKVLKLPQCAHKASIGGGATDENHKTGFHEIEERKSSYNCSHKSAFKQRWQMHGKRAETRKRRVTIGGDLGAVEVQKERMHKRKRMSQVHDLDLVIGCHSYREEGIGEDQGSMLVLRSECQASNNDKTFMTDEVGMTGATAKKLRSTGMRELASLLSSTAVTDRRCIRLNGKVVRYDQGRLTKQEDRQGGSNVKQEEEGTHGGCSILDMDQSISSLKVKQLEMGESQMKICSSEDQKVNQFAGRCSKTDGRKWRCLQGVEVGSKYCKRHMLKDKRTHNS